MKKWISLIALAASLHAGAQKSLVKLWETDSVLAIPESVLPHPTQNLLYVSLIDGGAWEKDGKGGVALLDTNGKILNATWTTGLHAPKGMALVGNRLYVADVTDVAIIDAANGKVVQRIAIDSAQMLNDVTADAQGVVYVSDSRTGRVHRLRNQQPSLMIQDLQGVNGLKHHNGNLYVATSRQLLKADASGATTLVAETQMGGDGIEPTDDGGWVLSSWSGVIYYINSKGVSTQLLDTREQKKNTADIGYNPRSRVLYVPTFLAKSVAAYRLEE